MNVGFRIRQLRANGKQIIRLGGRFEQHSSQHTNFGIGNGEELPGPSQLFDQTRWPARITGAETERVLRL